MKSILMTVKKRIPWIAALILLLLVFWQDRRIQQRDRKIGTMHALLENPSTMQGVAESTKTGSTMTPASISTRQRVEMETEITTLQERVQMLEGLIVQLAQSTGSTQSDGPAEQGAALAANLESQLAATVASFGDLRDIPRPDGFKNIMLGWYDSDPDQMLSWLLNVENVKDQKELMKWVVDRSAKDDWRDAVELASLYRDATGRRIFMPGEVTTEIGKLAPEEFARISQLFAPFPPNIDYQFGEDFQFREALERLGSEYRHSSLTTEWGRRDLGAAWEWSYGNIKDQRQLEWLSLAWSEGASNDDFGEFAAFLMDESQWATEAERRDWSREQCRADYTAIVRDMLVRRPSPESFQSLLERVPNRQKTLREILGSTLLLHFEGRDPYRDELLNQMTAAERIRAFDSLSPYLRKESRQSFEGILAELGHSRAEIDRMVPAGKRP